MSNLLFCTGNHEKFLDAKLVCELHGLSVERREVSINEIQAESAEEILMDKLDKTFQEVRLPVVVSDDSWEIPALNGFPGPYMKSMNYWLKPVDYLNLTSALEDRSIYLTQRLGFTDGQITKTYTHKIRGTLLREVRGEYGNANHKLVSMDGDNGLTIAEVYDRKLHTVNRRTAKVWQDFITWYKFEYL